MMFATYEFETKNGCFVMSKADIKEVLNRIRKAYNENRMPCEYPKDYGTFLSHFNFQNCTDEFASTFALLNDNFSILNSICLRLLEKSFNDKHTLD